MEEVHIINQTGDKGNRCHSSQMAFPFFLNLFHLSPPNHWVVLHFMSYFPKSDKFIWKYHHKFT